MTKQMAIIGHGVDLVEIERIKRLLDEHPSRFVTRCFTPGEQAYAASGSKRRYERFAVRFAAKEAVFKALGTGWRDGIAWTDVEVVRQPSGQPVIRLTGRCAEIAGGMEIDSWQCSLSHTTHYAIASVIACREAVT